jgi:hypothetical protein
MRPSTFVGLVLAALLLIASPSRALAQVTFELGPLAGAYVPTRDFPGINAWDTRLPATASGLSAMAPGLDARVWFGPHLGFELQGAVAASTFQGEIPLSCPPPGPCYSIPRDHATITIALAQVMYRPATRVPIRVSAGVGIVRHGGFAYQPFNAPTPIAGALGADLDLPLGRSLVASLGVTTLVYALNVWDNLGYSYEHGTQVDLLPHMSLAWRWRVTSR